MQTEDDRVVFDQSRTVSWTSTVPFHPRMAKMSGREVLEAIRAGLLAPPPLARVIGFHIVAVGDGQAEFALEPRGDLENLAGALHGGVAASLLDNALGAAVQSLLPAGARSATLNLNVSYLRGLTVRSGTITAQGRVVRLTRSAAFVEGAVTNSQGEVCAQAVATFAVSYPEETSSRLP
ncbi:MAG TPA: PaaI family thioesterase [Bradyrhizobium sp.]|jgi:uncharacterized protein (TIGR00369 family)|nr:PaaI family thioesterase [Bradyrhizobium sp.]